jgi:hypothetical protein
MSAELAFDLDTNLADQPVLVSAPLKAGFDRQNLSRYGDQSWDLSPAVFRENVRRCHVTAHFRGVGDAATERALREFLYVRLNVALPGGRQRLPPASLRNAFNRAKRFFDYVRATLGVMDLARVDQSLIDAYARSLRADRRRLPSVTAQLLQVIVDLYSFRKHLPSDGLRFEPWHSRSTYVIAGHRHKSHENRTPRIPEPIIAPLLAWSLKYVAAFAPDILAARDELTALQMRCDALRTEDATLSNEERRARRRERLAAFLEDRRRRGRGVPIWTTVPNGAVRHDARTGTVTPPVNMHLLHLHVGIDAAVEPKLHFRLAKGVPELIAAAIDELGVEAGGMDTPISTDAETGLPWRPRFDVKTVVLEERMLQAAAYVVCAYLTGMRDCEVQAMRSGCLSLTRSEDGLIMRYRVRSVAYKGKQSMGEPAEWVTIAPVVQAIQVLERLSIRVTAARNADTLWPVLVVKASSKDHVSAEIVRQLNDYRGHLNALFGANDAPVIPPGPDGLPWRITTRQFRRTIAWHIANRPFGTIAGMIQYKHASVAAFEGYAGSSRSGFRAEVEAQRALGQIDDILAYFDERRAGMSFHGPAGPRIAKTMDVAADESGPLPAMIADRARLRTLLASLARTLHVGILADCFFDPATALCLKRATEPDRAAPLVALCEPTRCPNACITARHRPIWARAADDARLLLREKRLSEPQRTALRRDLDRIEAVLNGLTTSASADAAPRFSNGSDQT